MIPTGQFPPVPLDNLRVGECGAVISVDGPDHAVHHLQEVGLRVGCPVRMLRCGPPYLLQVGDCRLCLRAEPNVLVMVSLDPVNT